MSSRSLRSLDLSDREQDVMSLAAEGLTDKEIAQKLGIGAKTVRTYWERIRAKLGATSRTQALAVALRAAYEDLAKREEKFRGYIEELPALVMVLNEDGQVVYLNEHAANLVGARKHEALQPYETVHRLCPHADLRENARRSLIHEGKGLNGRELPLETKGGSQRTVAWYARPESKPSVRNGFVAVGVDVTEHARERELARGERAALSAVIEAADQGMWLVDAQFKTRRVNWPMAHLLMSTVEELRQRSPLEFVAPEDQAAAIALLEAGGAQGVPFRFKRCDGSFVPVRKSLLPIYSGEDLDGYLIIATERVEK